MVTKGSVSDNVVPRVMETVVCCASDVVEPVIVSVVRENVRADVVRVVLSVPLM